MGGEQPEWLPVGWKIRVKVRRCGKKDKYYVNPSNGLKLSSKPEVLRYLKSSRKDRKPKELDKIDIKNTVAKQLPPGWIKEIRTRKKGNKIRRDAYYIDPVSGRHLRSMQEVYRHIKSMDSGEATSKPDDKGHFTLEVGDHSKSVSRLVSSDEAKGQRSIGKKADKHPTRNQRVKPGEACANGLKGASMKNVKMLEGDLLEKREDDSLANEISDKLHQVNRMKGRADKIIVIKKLDDQRVDKKSPNSDQRSKSGAKVIGLRKVDVQREKEDDFVAGNLPNKSPRVDVKEQVNGGRRRNMRLAGSSKQNKIVTEVQSSRLGSEGSAGKNINLNNDLERRGKENNSTGGGQQHKNLARQKKRKPPNRKCTGDLPGRPSKRRAQRETEHPSLEITSSNKSGVSATLSDDSEVTTTKNAVKDGLADEPLIVDTNGKISNDSNKNSANNLEQHKSLAHRKKRNNPISKFTSDLNGRASKRLAQLEIKHPSLEIKTINNSEVSATLSEGSEVTTTKNLVKGGLSGKPLIDDTDGKIGNGSNVNPIDNQGQHKPIVLYKRRKKSNSKCTSDLPGRTSKRLAQIEIAHPSLEIKTSGKSGVSATLSDESEVTTTKNIVKDGPSDESLIDDTNGNISNGSNENPVNHQGKTTTHDCKEDEKESRNLDSPLEDLLMDPCIEFAFKTLTGAIPIEEVNKVGDSPVSSLPLANQTLTPSKLPSGHIWADPCFEFAVKMLTGEMPTVDNAQFHASFQQPLGSSLDNLNSSSYSVSQIDVLKTSLSQEGVKDPSYPHGASGSSRNSVGTSRD